MPIADVFGAQTQTDNSSKLIVNDLSAQIDGTNTNFTTTEKFENGSIQVFWNGLRQSANEITELSDEVFRISTAPQLGDSVLVQFYPI
ncbi:MAG: hypothetical protein VX565_00365 [Pseudomonadota bacterium]|nr:hypothetical protein [Pseudomonadota bacterium]